MHLLPPAHPPLLLAVRLFVEQRHHLVYRSGTIDVADYGKVESGAVFDIAGTYRYALFRIWDHTKPIQAWFLLNPSTASHEVQDATARRGMDFSKAWGCGGMCFMNEFALRSRHPSALKTHPDPVGPDNDDMIKAVAAYPHERGVICAWGASGSFMGRDRKVYTILRANGCQPQCLLLTKGNQPGHPLYLSADSTPFPLRGLA
jgi:hypothetical protein